MTHSRSVRVLFVNRMASMVRGGGETFDLEMSRHLDKLGCETRFLSGLPLLRGAHTPVNHPRAFTIRTPYTGWMRWERILGGWRIRQADFMWFEKKAAAWAADRSAEFDVVQVCELPFFVAEWKRRNTGIPVIMRMTSPIYYDPWGGIQKADAVIASGTTIQKIREKVRPDCVDIPNGVDTDLFRPHESPFRKQHGIDPDELVVLYVARFAGVKNHPMLIRAFSLFLKEWPRARLVLLGGGPGLSEIKRLCEAEKISDKVLIILEMPFAGVPDLYAAADIKVIASEYESFSFTTLEAMASGLPLVVTDTEWVPQLIGNDKGGRVVPRNNPELFCRALLELARDPRLRKEMGRENRDRAVREYGWDSSAKKMADLCDQLRTR